MANSQDKSFDTIESGLEGVDKKLSDTQKQTGEIGKGLQDTGRLGKVGFNAIGTAIKATGIGLLVGLVAKLIEKFTENKKVAEALEVVFNGIGAVINTIFELAEPLGDALINAFKNPMEAIRNIGDAIKQNLITRFEGLLEFLPAIGNAISLVFKGKWEEAGKVAADAAGKMVLGVENITDKVGEAAEAVGEFASDFVNKTGDAIKSATDLTKAQQRLRDQQRELNVEYAEARAEIEQLKQKRDDERLSIEERIAAAERAAELDQQFAEERMDIANAEVALIQQEIALQGETEERLDRLAEARIAAAEAAESSAAVQTELMTSIYGLNQEAIAIEEERIAKEQEAAEERKRLLDEEAKLKKENAEKEIADNRAVLDDRLAYANASLDALRQLNEAFAGDSEKEQERAFKRNKAIGIAQAIINTAGAVVAAINPAVGGLGIPAGLPGAALAALTGAAQVATIARSQFGGGGGGSTPSAPSRTVSEPAPTTPQLDLGFLGGGAGQTGFRTYVVSSEVSNAQQANQRINDQATLVG
jgi:chromosome segregation ATPase